MIRSTARFVALSLLGVLIFATTALGSRPPTDEELAGIELATQESTHVGPSYFVYAKVRVSEVGPWAAAELKHPYRGDYMTELAIYRKRPEGWKEEDSGSGGICIGPDLSALGMPAAVGRDLELDSCRRHPSRPKIFVQRGFGPGEELFYRPHVFYLSGDGTLYLTGVRWRHYGGRVATATATAHLNDCVPYCAAGHFSIRRAKVRLKGPIHCENSYINAYVYTHLLYKIFGVPHGDRRRRGNLLVEPTNSYGKPAC
jgi:hypothetical protein